jgi:phosphoribosylformimino-5-aminoimidazole carboxamide ribotide isomerase
MNIIPAIDIINGECVRLLQGNYTKKTTYSTRPLAVARQFESLGATLIHLVDLDGAKMKQVINWSTIENICSHLTIPIQFGGGVRTASDISRLLSIGVSTIIIGSLAIQNPELLARFISQFGNEKISIAIDVKDGKPKTSGWLEIGNTSLKKLIGKMIEIGARRFIVTDIGRDGTLSSPNIGLYQEIQKEYPDIELVASGGVSQLSDLKKLKEIGVSGVILGKSLYEKKIDLKEAVTL